MQHSAIEESVVKVGFPQFHPIQVATAPIGWEQPLTHIAMKRRISPIHHPMNPPMLHGVKMQMINIAMQIVLIPDGMFPIAALPHQDAAIVSLRNSQPTFCESASEFRFEGVPTRRILHIGGRQGLYRM